jgi:hypothetical protein
LPNKTRTFASISSDLAIPTRLLPIRTPLLPMRAPRVPGRSLPSRPPALPRSFFPSRDLLPSAPSDQAPSVRPLPLCDLHATRARHSSHRRRGRPQRLRRGKDGPSLDLRASPPLPPPSLDPRASPPPLPAMDLRNVVVVRVPASSESLFPHRVAMSVLGCFNR